MEKLTIKLSEDVGGWGFSLENFDEQIKGTDAKEVVIPINSYGGSYLEGIAMYNRVKGLEQKTTAKAIGFVMSAGTLPYLAADKREMPKNSYFLIHNVWTMAAGDDEQMAEVAAQLKMFNNDYAQIVADNTKLTKSQALKLMKEDRIMSAKEAKKLGFVDTLTDAVQYEASFDASKYSKLTNQFMSEIEKVETTEEVVNTEETCTEGTCEKECDKAEEVKDCEKTPCCGDDENCPHKEEVEVTVELDTEEVKNKVMAEFKNVLSDIVEGADSTKSTKAFTSVVASMKSMMDDQAKQFKALQTSHNLIKNELDEAKEELATKETEIETLTTETETLKETVESLEQTNKELVTEEAPTETVNETKDNVINNDETFQEQFNREFLNN